MAVRLYEPKAAGAELQLWADPQRYVKIELEEELSALEELIALSPEARELANGQLDREDWDEFSAAQRARLKNLIDFFDYDTKVVDLTVADGAWFQMEAVEDFCGEEAPRPAVDSIDGDTGTFWQHDQDHAHQITWRLRDYEKRVSKVRVWLGANARSKLNNLDIYVANSVGGLNLPTNLAITGASISTADAWNEIDFTIEQVGQFVRFTGFGSQNSVDESRIREVEAWVETIEYD